MGFARFCNRGDGKLKQKYFDIIRIMFNRRKFTLALKNTIGL